MLMTKYVTNKMSAACLHLKANTPQAFSLVQSTNEQTIINTSTKNTPLLNKVNEVHQTFTLHTDGY